MRTVFKWARRVLIYALIALMLLQLYFFISVLLWSQYNLGTSSVMREQLAVLREKNPAADLQRQWVPYKAISIQLKRAVITSEDGKFAEHDGVDWDAIEKAYENNKKKGKRVKGGSTITQQVAKNLFLSGSRSYLRKGQELIITYMIELCMSKERILEIYLNIAEWGNGVFGAEAAARHYYNVAAAQLSAEQAARLAGMLPNPRFYDHNRGSAYLARRTSAIARYMPDAELP